MEKKILTILLDMQIDMKDLKKRVINIEENEIPSMKESINNLSETVKDIKENEIPSMKASINNIQNEQLPAIRQQRLIDNNNIAKILNVQTEILQEIRKQNLKKISNL